MSGNSDWRLQKPEKDISVKRFKTGIPSFDIVTGGGLAYGLNVFVGEAGTGKSLLAKQIALRNNSLYVVADSVEDWVESATCKSVNFTKFLPNPEKGWGEVVEYVKKLKVDLVVIDSITRFASAGKHAAAVEEADIRPILFTIAQACAKVMPVIAVSEVRGQGKFVYPAGGQAIAHAAHMLIWFNRKKIETPWDAKLYGMRQNEILRSVEITKDKSGVANQTAELKYTLEGEKKEAVFSDVTENPPPP